MKKQNNNYLDKIPVFNPDKKWEIDEQGKVTVTVENRGFWNKVAQKWFKAPKTSKIALDEFGSFIIPIIDGEKTVEDIAKAVKVHFGDKAEPLYNRLVTFMHTLEQVDFVKMK